MDLKIMIRFLLYLVLAAGINNTIFATCTENSTVIGAKYKVTMKKTDSSIIKTSNMILWRNGKQIAHEYIDTGITDVWEKTGNGMLRLVRYFDKPKQGIEYQPNEINNGKGEKNWSLKSQLISDKLINSMQQNSIENTGCDKTVSYTLKSNNKFIKLNWLPVRRLVKTYSESTHSTKLKWELIELITYKKQINNIFSNRADYKTTDYTDIGDNESDPFLMKMINLGFVEHSASGFYDSNGNHLNNKMLHDEHQH